MATAALAFAIVGALAAAPYAGAGDSCCLPWKMLNEGIKFCCSDQVCQWTEGEVGASDAVASLSTVFCKLGRVAGLLALHACATAHALYSWCNARPTSSNK